MPMRLVAAAVLLLVIPVTVWKLAASPSHPETSTTIYDPNPSHLWNRLYAVLFIREDSHGVQFGADSLDPLLWTETEHLLAEPSHERALRVLDEFLRTHAENLIHDPIKRAMLQRDLWAVFDWSVQRFPARDRPPYTKEKEELQARLAEVLRRLKLTPEELKSLPDNYSQATASGAFAKEYDPANRQRPFLPPNLFDRPGPGDSTQPIPKRVSGGRRRTTGTGPGNGRRPFLPPNLFDRSDRGYASNPVRSRIPGWQRRTSGMSLDVPASS